MNNLYMNGVILPSDTFCLSVTLPAGTVCGGPPLLWPLVKPAPFTYIIKSIVLVLQ